ncbi:hypothetical protein [Novosphingobium sp. BL-52-GroH]|uniref:hypothetical protein n=1 Tax=Novosphingobium sp. BL-52-GroH TaxID=3349877 RepID=UPI00384BE5CE
MVALGGAMVTAISAPGAMAASEPGTRLVSCGEQSCVLVSGYRADPASAVYINGHPVSVEGRRAWKVSLPVETVREWSAPRARTIDVTLCRPGADDETARADLPIGLLGHVTNLAALVVGSR